MPEKRARNDDMNYLNPFKQRPKKTLRSEDQERAGLTLTPAVAASDAAPPAPALAQPAAQTDIDKAKEELKEAKADLDKLKAELKEAEAKLGKAKAENPPDPFAIQGSQADVARARAEVDSASLAMRALEQQVAVLRATPELRPFAFPQEPFSFLETAEFELAKLIASRTTDALMQDRVISRDMDYAHIIGPMGVGKSRTALEACKFIQTEKPGVTTLVLDLSKWLQIDVRLVAWEKSEGAISPFDFLGRALLRAACPENLHVPDNLDTTLAFDRVERDLQARVVLLVIDEYQMSVPLSKKLIRACNSYVNSRVRFNPVIVGVQHVGESLESSVLGSPSYTVTAIRVKPLPSDAFERVFAASLRFVDDASWKVYESCKNLGIMYRDCGGLPHMAVQVQKEIKEYRGALEQLRLGNFPSNVAKIVYDKALTSLERVYGARRWHVYVGGRNDVDDDKIRLHDSWHFTERILKRVILVLVTQRFVMPGDSIIEDSYSYDRLASTGMVDWANNNELTAPLMATLIMNRVYAAKNTKPIFPLEGNVENPFDSDATVFERIAMVSVYMRCLACLEFGESQVDIRALRPGAYYQGPEVKVDLPPNVVFDLLTRYLSTTKLGALTAGMFVLTAVNQPQIDGLAVLGVRAEEDAATVVLVSQSKWQMDFNPASGEASDSTLYDKQIQRLIDGMRAEVAKSRDVFPVGPLFIVFDIFSVREPPRIPSGDFTLGANEALFITRKLEFEKVVGKTLAVRNRLRGLA